MVDIVTYRQRIGCYNQKLNLSRQVYQKKNRRQILIWYCLILGVLSILFITMVNSNSTKYTTFSINNKVISEKSTKLEVSYLEKSTKYRLLVRKETKCRLLSNRLVKCGLFSEKMTELAENQTSYVYLDMSPNEYGVCK